MTSIILIVFSLPLSKYVPILHKNNVINYITSMYMHDNSSFILFLTGFAIKK